MLTLMTSIHKVLNYEINLHPFLKATTLKHIYYEHLSKIGNT